MAQTTQEKIENARRLGSNLKMLEEEFNNKLFGSAPHGDVKLYQMIDFAKEHDWLLEMIIKVSKEID